MYAGTQQKYLVISSYGHEVNNHYFEEKCIVFQIDIMSVGMTAFDWTKT